MGITACICTHNRPAYLLDCLEGLRRQTVGARAFDILVVDSASTTDVPARIERMVAGLPNARLIRTDLPGISRARNIGAEAARDGFIAYLDDDAIPAPDWIARILAVLAETDPPPALIGGRILPRWEAPLPAWWPARLRGVLSIIEHEGRGEYRTADLPPELEPYGANMIVHVPALLAVGGFAQQVGRVRNVLLSDGEVQLAWRLQAAGYSARYDSRIVVQHQVQATRLTPRWLLSRLYCQGMSSVQTSRLLGSPGTVLRNLPRRLAVAVLLAPTALLPRSSTRLLAYRWRLAYAAGFVRAALAPAPRPPRRFDPAGAASALRPRHKSA